MITFNQESHLVLKFYGTIYIKLLKFFGYIIKSFLKFLSNMETKSFDVLTESMFRQIDDSFVSQ